MMPLLIVADDSAHMRWLVCTAFRDHFAVIVEAGDGRELFRQLLHASLVHPETEVVVITDIRMPAYSGIDILETYDELGYHPTTIVMTSFPDAAVLAVTERAGGILIPKPFSTGELRRVVEHACAAIPSAGMRRNVPTSASGPRPVVP